MNDHSRLEEALNEAVSELEAASIPYMLIGGLALAAWKLSRSTLDVDLTLWVDSDALKAVVDRLTARFPARVSDPINFVNRTRVLPVATVAGVRLDYIFAAFPFERTMLSRAVVRELSLIHI